MSETAFDPDQEPTETDEVRAQKEAEAGEVEPQGPTGGDFEEGVYVEEGEDD